MRDDDLGNVGNVGNVGDNNFGKGDFAGVDDFVDFNDGRKTRF